MKELTWKYLGGFFDGEGCAGLYINDYETTTGIGYSITPHIQITQYYKEGFLYHLRKWLKKEGIDNSLGKNNHITICSWSGTKIFCQKILPFIIIKKPQILLLIKAINVYYSLPKKGKQKRNLRLRMRTFLDIAIKLQDLKSKKGRPRKGYERFLARRIFQQDVINPN